MDIIFRNQFFTYNELLTLISEHELRQIAQDSNGETYKESLYSAIDMAIGRASGYMNHRYDVDVIFRPVIDYDSIRSYKKGDRVISGITRTKIYTALEDVLAGTSINDTDFWENKDNRDMSLVQCVIDWALFLFYHRTSGLNVPEFRVDAKDEAKEWFKQVQKGSIELNLPLLDKENAFQYDEIYTEVETDETQNENFTI